MSILGRQNYYCPFCGGKQYSVLPITTISACCSKACREEWELNVAKGIVGKSDEDKRVGDVSKVDKVN